MLGYAVRHSVEQKPIGENMKNAVATALPVFDLSFLVEQLCRKSQFKDWTAERFSQAVDDYREFLVLCKEEPNLIHEPTKDVDEIWHRHILNTKEYARDCQSYFGYFLNHIPKVKAAECGTSTSCTGECGPSRSICDAGGCSS